MKKLGTVKEVRSKEGIRDLPLPNNSSVLGSRATHGNQGVIAGLAAGFDECRPGTRKCRLMQKFIFQSVFTFQSNS